MKLARYCSVPTAYWSSLGGLLRHPFAGADWDSFFNIGAPAQDSTAGGLAVDVYEDEANYLVRFEVPGVKKEDAKIELEERRLALTVTRKTQSGENQSEFQLSRTLTIPEGVAAEGVSAKLENGILTVTLPKQEERKPRVITLN